MAREVRTGGARRGSGRDLHAAADVERCRLEAKMISERTKAALAAAKARGQQLGGDRGNIREIAHLGRLASAQLRQERARQRAADLVPIIADLRKRGVTSLRQIAAALNERGVPAPRGGAWAPAQVHRVVDQCA